MNIIDGPIFFDFICIASRVLYMYIVAGLKIYFDSNSSPQLDNAV